LVFVSLFLVAPTAPVAANPPAATLPPASLNFNFNSADENLERIVQQTREQAQKIGGSAQSVLTCSAHVAALGPEGKDDDMTFDIVKNKNSYSATITHKIAGQSSTEREAVTYFKNQVRAGLTPATDPYTDDLNDAERLILHAMVLTTAPEVEGRFSVDFNLSKARSARVYQMGEATRFGSASVVVASDEKGSVLGIFLGGFIVAACK
ncbi:MAG: hypothetical protein AAB401_23730, partial [Acidobacteriota bacterium]